MKKSVRKLASLYFSSFKFLENEPDIYHLNDLKKIYIKHKIKK